MTGTYEVTVLRPGVTARVSERSREYTEEELRSAVESLNGANVTDGFNGQSVEVIGRVVDSTYDEGVQCTIEIEDEEMAARIDAGLAEVAPALTLDDDEEFEPSRATGLAFDELFLTPEASKLVGDARKK